MYEPESDRYKHSGQQADVSGTEPGRGCAGSKIVKRLPRPMLGFKSFWAARCTIAGMEVMHAIRKGQLTSTGNGPQTPAEQFYALAA